MSVKLGGQKFTPAEASVTVTVNIHPRTTEQFAAAITQLLSLDDSFSPPEVHASGETVWVTRLADNEATDVTVFALDDATEQDIIDYLAAAAAENGAS